MKTGNLKTALDVLSVKDACAVIKGRTSMKSTKLSISILAVFFVSMFSLSIVHSALADSISAIRISDDALGGECATVGQWYANTKTCELTADVILTDERDGIRIASDGITLFCNGHLITGNGSTGILLQGRSGVTVAYCTVQGFYFGISILNSSNNTFNNNAANANGDGFYLYGSNYNILNNNTAGSNTPVGIYLGAYCDSNTLNNNTADNNAEYGFYDDSAAYSIYNHNECSGNGIAGSSPAGLCSPQ
jgi:parallel beta-helix repeat protein